MMRAMLPVTMLWACAGEKEPTVEDPVLEILAPTDGATVPAGDVGVSVTVEHFVLQDPGTQARTQPPSLWTALVTSAWAHPEEGVPQGFVVVTLDGTEVARTGETQVTVPGVAAGPHELLVELLYEDGDRVEPPVEASVSFTAE